MITETRSVMDRLKAGTRDLHEAAETHVFQRALAAGQVAREAYASWLGQMLLVHRALEGHLRRARTAMTAMAALATDDRFHEAQLADDLGALGVPTGAVKALPGTQRLIASLDEMAGRAPIALIGSMYVLEGSTNGNRYLARALSGTLGLVPGQPGMRYLDPYGEEQRPRWTQWRARADEQAFSASDVEALLDAACAMFKGITAISADLASVAGLPATAPTAAGT